MKSDTVIARAFPCDYCQAEVGDPCISSRGKPVYHFHKPRLELMARLKDRLGHMDEERSWKKTWDEVVSRYGSRTRSTGSSAAPPPRSAGE